MSTDIKNPIVLLFDNVIKTALTHKFFGVSSFFSKLNFTIPGKSSNREYYSSL